MTTFDNREQGFEKKFALDQEQEFKAHARRNRALGQWAAGLMTNDPKLALPFVESGEKTFERVWYAR